MFLLIAHFAGPPAVEAGDPVALLAAQPQTTWLRWAQSTEEPARSVLVAQFASAAEYRRALAGFDVRTIVVPWLSSAEVTVSGVYEVVATADRTGSADDGALVLAETTVAEPGR